MTAIAFEVPIRDSSQYSNRGNSVSDSPNISLCLSGGGYRAAIFHLGALRWLNQCGVLPRLHTVSAVSGGSILAAHVAHCFNTGWPTARLDEREWEERVVEPFWHFVSRDIRTWPVLVRFLWPPNWLRPWSTVEALREQYRRHLLHGKDISLASLASPPKFIFCATDMVFGVNWEASRERVGDYEAGYVKPPPVHWTLARAVAASSCFPPIFPPAKTLLSAQDLTRGRYRDDDRDACVDSIVLTDGGVYDNLALQPVFRHRKVLVSDGGGQLTFTLLRLPWRRLGRYPALLQHGIGKLRKSWLMDAFKGERPTKIGAYWGIAQRAKFGSPFPDKWTSKAIGAIRTDLNGFTRAEFEILQNHGFLLAACQTSRMCPRLLSNPPPLNKLHPPYPVWTDMARLRQALRWSHRRFWPRVLR